MKILNTLLLFLLFVMAGCGGNSDRAVSVPRPVAYHRIVLYDSVYRAVDRVPVRFEVNSSAIDSIVQSKSGATSLDILYPAYKAVVYCTFSPVDESNRDAVIENRRERLSMNTGGFPTEITRIDSGDGFQSELLFTPAGTYTPVQFISVGSNWVISGSCAVEDATTRSDSLRPVLEAIHADMFHTLQSLR